MEAMSIDRINIAHDTVKPEKMHLLEDRVLVEVIERDRSSGGLWLAGEGVKTECSYGKVIALGPGLVSAVDGVVYPMPLKVGETVLSMDFIGDKLHSSEDGKQYRVIRDHAIWAKIKLGKNYELLDIEPYSSRVLVEITENLKTVGGIHLPTTHQTRGYTMAKVVKIGRGWRDLKTGYLYPMTCKSGDTVCMTRYAGSIVKLDHRDLRLIEERPYMEGDKQPDILFIHEDWKGWKDYD
jgi:co-chaperonin GroES (HSP10)